MARRRPQSSNALDHRLEEWADGFPVDEVKRELDHLRKQRRDIDSRMRALGRKLAFWEAARQAALGTTSERLGVPEPLLPAKRDAILHVLAEQPDREFRLVEIREALILRGWLASDGKAAHALEVAATTLAKSGEVERLRRGVYRARHVDAATRAAA